MKNIRFFFVIALLLSSLTSHAQFWQGFMMGMMNAAQRQAQNYNRPERTKSEPIKEVTQSEKDGFVWIRISQWNPQDKQTYYGAKDTEGNVMISLSNKYTFICYHSCEGFGGYFAVDKNSGEGVYDRHGKLIYSPTPDGDYICVRGKFMKKNSAGDWVDTTAYLDCDGHGHKKSSSSSQSSSWGNIYYVGPGYSTTPAYPSGGVSTDSPASGSTSADVLNETVGSDCMTCHGTGKCPTCNGTKVAHSMGNTYTCTICDEHGNCPSCHGTGKANWNR